VREFICVSSSIMSYSILYFQLLQYISFYLIFIFETNDVILSMTSYQHVVDLIIIIGQRIHFKLYHHFLVYSNILIEFLFQIFTLKDFQVLNIGESGGRPKKSHFLEILNNKLRIK
jgi:hypothetical protein